MAGFNEEFYGKFYPRTANHYNYGNKLKEHWNRFGQDEGRFGNFNQAFQEGSEQDRQKLQEIFPDKYQQNLDSSVDYRSDGEKRDFGKRPILNRNLASAFPNFQGNFGSEEWQNYYLNEMNASEQARANDIFNAFNTADVETVNTANIKNPNLPSGTTFNPVSQQATEEELMDPANFMIDPEGAQATLTKAYAPNAKSANTYNASTIGNNVAQGQAAQGQVSQNAQVDAATREGAYADYQSSIEQARQEAKRFELDKRATVQEQYKQLMDFEPDETPPWAKGAIREAESRMAARGLGASSMAGGAVSAAVMKEALPIAAQDARAFQTMSMEKFNKRQQAMLMKAGHLANLDMQSLNNQQQTAVENARAFLQMDMSNLNNRQQMAIMNTQSRVQAMFSDQAAENAAKQFNAQSQNDMTMFYDSLQTQVEQFNAAQANEISKFNAEVQNQREQFNVKNKMLIEKSNVEYLRGISTRNTQMQNQANYVNSQNLLDISNTAMANSIQLLRDRAAFSFDAGQNALDRATTKWVTGVQTGVQMDIADQRLQSEMGAAFGNLAGTVIGGGIQQGWFDGVFDWGSSDDFDWDTPVLDSFEF